MSTRPLHRERDVLKSTGLTFSARITSHYPVACEATPGKGGTAGKWLTISALSAQIPDARLALTHLHQAHSHPQLTVANLLHSR
ncbi:hypothetical protein BDN67DRAFT_963649 [Paxillus ammoniavirescens]|nr:hypothetical protein BDN67DRAFT_963649 [Paxillus ammoniavirescens]